MISRASATVLLGATLTAWASGSAQSLTGTIVASNMTTSTVSLIDAATGRTVATLETAVAPHEVAVSHDGRWAVVAEYGDRSAVGHSLLVIDLTSGAMARRIDLGELKRPHGLRFLPGDRRLVVTSEVARVIALVDFESGVVATTIETGANASHMVATTASGERAFVTNIVPGSVSVFDLGQETRTALHEVGTMVEGIATTPDGREVWAGGNRSSQVHVVDPASGEVVATIPGFGMPYRIAITADGERAVVTDPGAERIHVVDVASRRIAATIDVPAVNGAPASPQGVTLVPDGRHAVVTLKGANQVVLLDIPAARIVATYATGGGSDGVGFSPVVVTPR
ncbi:MAG: YncE family protein [Gemmatimonadales bacterium]